jgi:ribosome-associated heat shock protein Hsp15
MLAASRAVRRSHVCAVRSCEHAAMEDPAAPVRVDKWLWAARLLKTRALAADAVKGGRVHVNGGAVKPSRELRPGDLVEVTLGPRRLTVVVRGTSERRGPAKEAALLYEETPESREAGERAAAERRLVSPTGPDRGARPTKRDRRRFEQATGKRRRSR